MDDARRIGVVVAPELDHPALRVPAPRGVEDPQHRADQHGDDPEGARPRALDDRARDDRGGGDGEEQERAPEDAVEAVPVGGLGRRDVDLARIDAREMGRHQRAPRLGEVGCHQPAVDDARAVDEGEIDPPAEEIEGDGDERDRHRVLHQRLQVVAPARHADLVGTEPHVNEEHHHDRHPVIELGEDHRQSIEIAFHLISPPVHRPTICLSVKLFAS